MKPLFLTLILVSQLTTAAWAGEQSVALSVPGMNCPVCPITARKALEKVDGVRRVEVDYDSRSVVVVFDNQLTDTEALTMATENSGYPSIIMGADPS